MSHMDPTEKDGLQGAILRAMRQQNEQDKAARQALDAIDETQHLAFKPGSSADNLARPADAPPMTPESLVPLT